MTIYTTYLKFSKYTYIGFIALWNESGGEKGEFLVMNWLQVSKFQIDSAFSQKQKGMQT